jgi:hypothetical protein
MMQTAERTIFTFSGGLGKDLMSWMSDGVMVVSALLYASGLWGMAHATSPAWLALTAGVMVGAAQAGTTFAIVFGIIGRNIPAEKRSWAMGVVSSAGSFGESVLSTVASQAVTSGQVLDITVNNVAGSLATKIYVGTSTGSANAHYVGSFASLTGTLGGSASATTNDHMAYNTTGTLANTITADTSAYANGYDGIIPQIIANGGYVNDANAQFSTANPGAEFQTVFAALYDSVKADPDEILLNGSDRKQLSDAIKNGSTANYRLNLTQSETGDYVGGAVIGGLHNEITGKLVDLTVHPWLPQGVAPVLSYTLPIPDTEVSDVWAVVNVQDYMGVQWPVTQFAYEFSTYWRGGFVGYAPAWNGIVTGIKSA